MQSPNRVDILNRFIFGNQSATDENAYKLASEASLFLKKDSAESEMDIVVSDTADLPTLSIDPDGLTASTRGAISGHKQLVLSSAGQVDLLFPRLRQGLKMFFIGHIEHSRSRLRITAEIFNRLLEKGDIFPAVKDSILRMGRRDRELEVAPPPARSRVKFEKISSCFIACGFELVYGLRFIERNLRKADRSKGKPWSLRQFFAYNMTHYTEKDSRWVFFGLPEVIRTQVDAFLADSSQEIVQHPFDLHVLLVSAAIRMWRPYFMSLTDLVEDYRRMIADTDVSNKKAVQKAGKDMMSELKNVESDILDAFLAVRATKDTLIKIQSLFKSVAGREGVASGDEDCHNLIAQAISDQLREIDLLTEQATSLQQKATSLSATVADFLNLANAYWQEGNAKAVAGLSVIATVFLPVTVVFGFFSTSFMDKQNASGHPQGRWWLLLACGLPLSFATLMLWYMWVHRDGVRRRLRWVLRLGRRFCCCCSRRVRSRYSMESPSMVNVTDRRLEDIVARPSSDISATQPASTDPPNAVPSVERPVSTDMHPEDPAHDSGISEAGSESNEKIK